MAGLVGGVCILLGVADAFVTRRACRCMPGGTHVHMQMAGGPCTRTVYVPAGSRVWILA